LLTLCCVSKPEVPADVMSKEAMVSYLIDIHILEGKVTQLVIPRDSTELLYRFFEDRLKTEHNLNDSIYMQSLEFYYGHPELMEEIYSAVLDSLSLYERMSEEDEKK